MTITPEQLLQSITQYVDDAITPYLEVPGHEEQYPGELLDGLAQLGAFGATVSQELGGLGLPPAITPRLNEELARGWQSLIALLGTHLSLCAYFTNCGTDSQKATWLPQLATGQLLAGHAYHERSRPLLHQIQTLLRRDGQHLYLDGHKDWVTNAGRAGRLMVVCRQPESDGLAAVWLDPATEGVTVSPDLPRSGVKGVPLNSVTFEQVPIDERDIVGGLGFDITPFMEGRGAGADISFTARALGVARAILEETELAYSDDAAGVPGRKHVNAHRVTEMRARVFAIRALLTTAMADAGRPDAGHSASFAKVVGTRTLQEVAQLAMAVVGGSAFASSRQRLHRSCRDALSLTLVDTTNGTLLGAITAEIA